jgi:hypothetical protein
MIEIFLAVLIASVALVLIFSKPKLKGDNFIIAALVLMAVIGLLFSL